MAAQVIVISGFLGAGKTTLIRRLAEACWPGQKLALIENEFGEVGVDGAFLSKTGLKVRELTSGCICCSLAGDFAQALREVTGQFSPEKIVIEPSGVAKLSEILHSIHDAGMEPFCTVTVCDAELCLDYAESFGEFYLDQVKNADLILLSHTEGLDAQSLDGRARHLGTFNPRADILAAPWDTLDAETLLQALDAAAEKRREVPALQGGLGHMHHHHDHHHQDHEAGQVFVSWACRPACSYTPEQLQAAARALAGGSAGDILRAKGVVRGGEGWLEFDYIRGHADVRPGSAQADSAFCVIGVGLQPERLANLFPTEIAEKRLQWEPF